MTAPTVAERLFAIERLLDTIFAALTPVTDLSDERRAEQRQANRRQANP